MKYLFRICLLLMLAGLSPFANAAEAQLLNVPLPALPDDQEVLVLEVDLAPGQESAPHRHNAHVYVYVLKGR